MVDAIATVDESGKVLVDRPGEPPSLEERGMHDQDERILLDGRYEATILAGDSPEAFNDVEHPNRVVPERTQVPFKKGVVSLLPHSLTIVRIPWK